MMNLESRVQVKSMNTSFLLFKRNPIAYTRLWLSSIEIYDSEAAQLLCRIIPASCPFERDIKLFNRILAHIPSLCKLNPFYNQLMQLRFKSLAYLANQPSGIE
jgi:Mo-dependent nitrogenase C-terminus